MQRNTRLYKRGARVSFATIFVIQNHSAAMIMVLDGDRAYHDEGTRIHAVNDTIMLRDARLHKRGRKGKFCNGILHLQRVWFSW